MSTVSIIPIVFGSDAFPQVGELREGVRASRWLKDVSPSLFVVDTQHRCTFFVQSVGAEMIFEESLPWSNLVGGIKSKQGDGAKCAESFAPRRTGYER